MQPLTKCKNFRTRANVSQIMKDPIINDSTLADNCDHPEQTAVKPLPMLETNKSVTRSCLYQNDKTRIVLVCCMYANILIMNTIYFTQVGRGPYCEWHCVTQSPHIAMLCHHHQAPSILTSILTYWDGGWHSAESWMFIFTRSLVGISYEF